MIVINESDSMEKILDTFFSMSYKTKIGAIQWSIMVKDLREKNK